MAQRSRQYSTIFCIMLVLLTRDAEPSVLVAYLASKHPALTPLLPQDTQPVDLFNRVARKKELNVFFDMEEAEDVRRSARVKSCVVRCAASGCPAHGSLRSMPMATRPLMVGTGMAAAATHAGNWGSSTADAGAGLRRA